MVSHTPFTLPTLKRWQIWFFVLVLLYGFNVVIIEAARGLTSSDAISLLSADLLAMLVLIGVLPFEREPEMELEDAGHAFTYEVKHKFGEFKLRLLFISVGNKEGTFAKAAKDVKVNILLGEPYTTIPSTVPLPWQYYPEGEIRINNETIDPTSPESVVEALNKSVFSKRKTDFNPSDAWLAIVAFGLSTTGGIYAATEKPIRLDIPILHEGTKAQTIFSFPVSLRLSSPDLSKPPTTRPFSITGSTWENAIINPIKGVRAIELRTIRKPEDEKDKREQTHFAK